MTSLPRRRRSAPRRPNRAGPSRSGAGQEHRTAPDIDVHHAGYASHAAVGGAGGIGVPLGATPHDDDLRPPHALLMLMEARAPWEYAALLAATPWLARLPVGDGHPVIVYPGLGASDFSTAALRNFLRDRGYTAYAWKQGFNFGPRGGVLEGCRAQLAHVAARHRERVSLVGWSLGGIYARELAKEQPENARCVITLGTPFAGHPRATNAWRFYEMVSGQSVHDHALVDQIKVPPGCPTTSIYSRSDGIVAWQCSINPEHPHTENI